MKKIIFTWKFRDGKREDWSYIPAVLEELTDPVERAKLISRVSANVVPKKAKLVNWSIVG